MGLFIIIGERESVFIFIGGSECAFFIGEGGVHFYERGRVCPFL